MIIWLNFSKAVCKLNQTPKMVKKSKDFLSRIEDFLRICMCIVMNVSDSPVSQ